MSSVKEYYRLVKPGIVYGNVFTAIAGFLFAARWREGLYLFLPTVLGIALVIASACVFNNCLDRGIDRKMARTKDRAVAAGTISIPNALIYGTLLALIGFALLAFEVNVLAAALALTGWVFYVALYGLAKRASPWGTEVGSISGAIPIIVGYTGAAGRLDAAALILFLILVFWQMPHFYAIALYRRDDYAAAGIPVLPLQRGAHATKVWSILYILAFILATVSLAVFGYAGYAYLIPMLALGLFWLAIARKGFAAADDVQWARQFFHYSLIVLVAFSVLLAVAPLLP